MRMRTGWTLCSLALLFAAGGCSNGRGSVEDQAPPSGEPQEQRFSVGGTVAGLSGDGLVLRNNGGDDLSIGSNGGFAFGGLLATGAAYAVAVAAQPSGGQTCAVANGAGTIQSANVTNVTVTCTNPGGEPGPATYSIGGEVTGLQGAGLVLQNNGETLPIDSNGEFTFATFLASGAVYRVTVAEQPSGPAQSCSVSNASGTVDESDVTNVRVACQTAAFSVGGTVSGLLGRGLVLQNNGGDDLQIDANGRFTFAGLLASGDTYSVTVTTQPTAPAQSCSVRRGSGTVNANVSNIEIVCSADRFTIGGAVSGLEGDGLRLRLNGGDTLDVVGNGPFAFSEALASGAAYNVVVVRQPRDPTQVCTVDNRNGVVQGANVTNVAVACQTSRFRVGGSVSGLNGSGLRLQLNDGETLSATSNGSFTFDTQLLSGSPYRVRIAGEPAGQSCTVSNASGEVGGSDVSNVRIACATDNFSVGGAVSGLLGRGLTLTNNGGDAIEVDSNGAFTFPRELANGASYDVRVRSQPTNPTQTCSVARGSGAISGADVTNVAVTCSTSEYTIGGEVRDLSGSGLVLRNNGADDLRVDANGRFTFATPLPSGARYDVTVASQPREPAQVCSVSNGAGQVGGANVTNIRVECEAAPGFRVRGRVSGLRGDGLLLQNNGGDDLAIASNGRFTFATRLPSGSPYSVTVARQPDDPDQTCEVDDGAGVIRNSDVEDVEVECETDDDDDD